jgi:pyruvate formate lyase activating enzyme
MDNDTQQDIPAEKARIRAVTPLSLCDWPGRNVSVVYLGGCNLRCPTCHNATLAFTPSLHPRLDTDAVLRSLKARGRWLDGVVVCGGEPTLDPGLPALVDALHGLGLPVKVDTNGMLPEVVASVRQRHPSTLFAVDVKGPWDTYPALTGGAVTRDEARQRLEAVFSQAMASPASFTFRITLVPGLSPEDVQAAREYLPRGFTLREQPYVPPARREESPHAPADTEARRMPGNLVPGTHRPSHPEGAQG